MSRPRLMLVAGVAMVLLAALGWWIVGRSGSTAWESAHGAAVRAPPDTRVRVEVFNGTRTRGLARRATRHLRDRGFDVVGIGTWPTRVDSTLVLDRSGHPEWARLVAAALGDGRVEARPDSSRYLDVTVVLGPTWSPAPEPFDP